MATKAKKSVPKFSEAELRELIQEATVDCYDDEEQIMGLSCMIEENLDMPFETEVLGVPVTVDSIQHIRSREIVAICRNGKKRQAISLADLPLPSPPPEGAEWIAAYRHWASMF